MDVMFDGNGYGADAYGTFVVVLLEEAPIVVVSIGNRDSVVSDVLTAGAVVLPKGGVYMVVDAPVNVDVP